MSARPTFREIVEFGLAIKRPDGRYDKFKALAGAAKYGRLAAREKDPGRREEFEQFARKLSVAVKGMLAEDLDREDDEGKWVNITNDPAVNVRPPGQLEVPPTAQTNRRLQSAGSAPEQGKLW